MPEEGNNFYNLIPKTSAAVARISSGSKGFGMYLSAPTSATWASFFEMDAIGHQKRIRLDFSGLSGRDGRKTLALTGLFVRSDYSWFSTDNGLTSFTG